MCERDIKRIMDVSTAEGKKLALLVRFLPRWKFLRSGQRVVTLMG
jgi:hypothetical protein